MTLTSFSWPYLCRPPMGTWPEGEVAPEADPEVIPAWGRSSRSSYSEFMLSEESLNSRAADVFPIRGGWEINRGGENGPVHFCKNVKSEKGHEHQFGKTGGRGWKANSKSTRRRRSKKREKEKKRESELISCRVHYLLIRASISSSLSSSLSSPCESLAEKIQLQTWPTFRKDSATNIAYNFWYLFTGKSGYSW